MITVTINTHEYTINENIIGMSGFFSGYCKWPVTISDNSPVAISDNSPVAISDYQPEMSQSTMRQFIQKPIVIEHDYFEITVNDISQALFIITNGTVKEVHNLCLMKFLLEYFIAEHAIMILDSYVRDNEAEFERWELYHYGNTDTKYFKHEDLQQLLLLGYNLNSIIEKADPLQLLPLYEYDIVFQGRPTTLIPSEGYLPRLAEHENGDYIPYKDSEREIYSRPLLQKDEHVILPYNTSVERIPTLIQGINWDGVILAGGSLEFIVSDKLIIKDFPASDLDLFVYGENRQAKINSLAEYFLNKGAMLFQRENVITCIFRRQTMSIQLIDSGENDIESILLEFDTIPMQVAYTGNKFICTPAYIYSQLYKRHIADLKNVNLARLAKCLKRGYSVVVDSYCTLVTHDSVEYCYNIDWKNIDSHPAVVAKENKYLYITNESDTRILYMVQCLFSPKYTKFSFYDYECQKNWRTTYSEEITKESIRQEHGTKVVLKQGMRNYGINLDVTLEKYSPVFDRKAFRAKLTDDSLSKLLELKSLFGKDFVCDKTVYLKCPNTVYSYHGRNVSCEYVVEKLKRKHIEAKVFAQPYLYNPIRDSRLKLRVVKCVL